MLVVERVMQVNPLSVVVIHSRKSGKKHVDKVLELEQYKRLLRYYNEKSVIDLTVFDLITWVTLSTGMRTGEALDLKVDDFDVDGGVRIESSYDDVAKISKTTKTERSKRTVPMPKHLVEKIMQWYQIHVSSAFIPYEHVFVTKDGTVPTSRALNHRFKKTQQMVLDLQKTETVSNHATRHSFISVMMSPNGANLDVVIVAEMVGDTVETVQRIYHHVFSVDKALNRSVVLNKIDSLMT